MADLLKHLVKHLERAEKYFSKNKLSSAIQEYKAAYALNPDDLNLLRTIADLCVRAGKSHEALRYYGELFDRYAEKNDAAKGISLFRKFLQDASQPPERYTRLGWLLQRSKKNEEAVDAYRTALELWKKAGKERGILDALERLAALDPDNPDSHIELGVQANKMGRAELAGRAFLRAGQLVRADDLDHALELLERAYGLAPERSTALSLAQARLDKGHPQQAAELLLSLYTAGEHDPAVLDTLATALLATNRLAQAEEVLELLYQAKPDAYEKLFELADLYIKAGEAEKGVALLRRVRQHLFDIKRGKLFTARLEGIFKANQAARSLAEFAAATFSELNEESRYAMVLGTLFHLCCQAQDYEKAADALERLIEIDPYDVENAKRAEKLKEKLSPARLRAISARLTSAVTVSDQTSALSPTAEEGVEVASLDPVRRRTLLDDMIVQVEILLQYSLKAKAIEKLEKIYQMFPGEEACNDRLYNLYEVAQYFPEGFQRPSPAHGAPSRTALAAAAPSPAPPGPESFSDLAKISEITHTLYRQNSPKTVLHAGVTELGKHLHASRCLGALGRPGKPSSTAVEYCRPGVPHSPATAVVKLLGLLNRTSLDAETGAVLEADRSPELKQTGAQSVLAMPLINKETHEQEGLIVLSQLDQMRHWQPNEIYLLKAVADQVATALSHTRLRTLMKRLSVADDSSGLLARSGYLDCLVNEATRAKNQGTPLVIVLLELDKGAQLLRQRGEATLQQFMQQVGETVVANVRQTDLTFRYTATSVAVVLGDTTGEKVKPVVEKLRATLGALSLPGGQDSVSFSAGVSEAAIRPDYDPADIVTDVVNRAEFSLEEARQEGDALVVR